MIRRARVSTALVASLTLAGCTTGGGFSSLCSNGVQDTGESDVDCGGGGCAVCGDERLCAASDNCAAGLLCVSGRCSTSSCTDRLRDGDESDIDCSGACSPCGQGHACAQDGDCDSQDCVQNQCSPGTCSDHRRDGEETDVDCGGLSTCGNCGADAHCLAGTDCESGVCSSAFVCVASDCHDGTQNGDETDRDCGGAHCDGCAEGRACSSVADCRTNTCTNGSCINDSTAPSCSDQAQDLGETDVDCGGPCVPCEAGLTCDVSSDCHSRSCVDHVCDPSSCSDERQNQSETDVDCGGECPGCENGRSCQYNSDCAGNNCATQSFTSTCADAACNDQRKNGLETDVDCGGSCGACAVGKHCNDNPDCALNYCVSGTCLQPLCTDHITNGFEVDVDCGGGSCMQCFNGKHCENNGDCRSGYCTVSNHLCATPTCTDHEKNGAETDVDCGGGTCPACANALHCEILADCQSNYCLEQSCAEASCSDHRLNGFEPSEDCGGTCAQKCPDNAVCHANSDCASGTCTYYNSTDYQTRFRCVAASCGGTVHLQDSGETDVDCGGVCAAICASGKGCLVDSDCAGLACVRNTCSQEQCRNGVKDANEAGDDCGGPCPPCGPTSSHVNCSFGGDCLSGFCDNGVCATQDLQLASSFPVDGTAHSITEEIQITFNQPVVPTSLVGCTGRNAPAGCNVLLQDFSGAFVPVWVAQPRATPLLVTHFVVGHGAISDQRDPYTFTIRGETAGPRAMEGGTAAGDLVIGFNCYPN